MTEVVDTPELEPSPFAGDPVLDQNGEEVVSDSVDDNEGDLDDNPDNLNDEGNDEGDDENEDDEGELSDDDVDDLLDDLDDDDGEDEDDDDDKVDTVPHAALHKERKRRQEVQGELVTAQNLVTEAEATIANFKTVFDEVQKQIKELGLESTIKVKAPEEASGELLEVRREQAAKKQQEQVTDLIGTLQEEASLHLEEFPQINGKDSEQAELILGFAMASTMLGGEPEESVLKAMRILNTHLTAAKKSGRRPSPSRKTPPRRGAKRKAASTTGSAIKKGDVKGAFQNMASDMMGD